MAEIMSISAGAQAGTAPVTMPWLEAVQRNTQTWLTACTGLARAYATAGQAQAQFAGEMMRFWVQDAPWLADLRSAGLVREGLIMAEQQAERAAEAARRTRAELEENGAAFPVPLPE